MSTFVDDFSIYNWVDILRQKSKVLNKFKEFKENVQKELDLNIQCLCTDNGGEYTST